MSELHDPAPALAQAISDALLKLNAGRNPLSQSITAAALRIVGDVEPVLLALRTLHARDWNMHVKDWGRPAHWTKETRGEFHGAQLIFCPPEEWPHPREGVLRIVSPHGLSAVNLLGDIHVAPPPAALEPARYENWLMLYRAGVIPESAFAAQMSADEVFAAFARNAMKETRTP